MNEVYQLTQEELEEFYQEYEQWLDNNPRYSFHLEIERELDIALGKTFE